MTIILNPLNIFTIIYLIIASYSDYKTREIPDYVNYSAFIIGFLYRSYSAIINQNHYFLLIPLILSLTLFGISYLLYITGGWGGGDTKLLTTTAMLLGWEENNPYFFAKYLLGLFIFMFLWSMIYALTIGLLNYKKVWKNMHKPRLLTLIITGIILYTIIKNKIILILFALLSLIEPIKIIQDTCFIKEIKAKELTLGDWIVKKTRIGNYELKPRKTGANEEDLRKVKKSNKKILIKEGVPLAPAFLLAYLSITYAPELIIKIIKFFTGV